MADDVGIKDGSNVTVTIAAKDIAGVLHPIHLIGDSTTGDPLDTSLPSEVVGNVAASATDSGNPVKIGGVYKTAPTLLTDAQRGDAQLNPYGDLRSQLVVISGSNADGASNVAGFAAVPGNQVNARSLSVQPSKFNGATWDRDRKPSAASRIPSAAASTNATSAKASAGDVHVVNGNNASGAIRYLKFYNKASAPTVGTDLPVLTLALPTGAFNFNLNGHYFSTGIAYAMTTGAADADTGALTAADVLGLTVSYA